jgi:hypothetical protein
VPGRNTTDAFEAFIGPFESAVACLGQAKITVSPGGRSRSQGVHAWLLNGGSGMPLSRGFMFRAAMNYEFLRNDELENGPWRCTTRAYMYAVEDRTGRELIAYH